ncbi:MAG: YidC/Oxa1 family membrane protein insertase [Ruminococcaceae bacterium]|nr:YidC/Oxa1 family membrane protein insertase [Oscillospiraceae bacterium]
MEIITVPFGWLLNFLYQLTNNYGLSLILFAILVQIVLLPITAKSKKSMMKMTRLQPRLNAIKEKYANDEKKQQEAMQQLQKEEGATMGCGGCLWSLVPLLILIPLYTIIREPLSNMLGASDQVIAEIGKILDANMSDGYWQISAAQAIYEDPGRFADIPGITAKTLEGINFDFLGIQMGNVPEFAFWDSSWVWNWAHIGAVLVPLISAGSQILQTQISRKVNDSLVTNEKGIQDKEAAEKSQSAQTSKVMMWMMPLMSLWIGFSVPVALSLYWFVGGVIRTVEDTILTKKYRKIYDAEDAERLKKAMELEAIEAEKERIRAEKRAANPDGITDNTSKKKLQKKQQQAEEAAKAAAKKEYDAKKGIVAEEVEEKTTLSGIADRPYCKGRAYDPNRYNNTEEE